MYLSFLEIYNEEIVDLLVKGKSQVCCKHAAVCVRIHKGLGIRVLWLGSLRDFA